MGKTQRLTAAGRLTAQKKVKCQVDFRKGFFPKEIFPKNPFPISYKSRTIKKHLKNYFYKTIKSFEIMRTAYGSLIINLTSLLARSGTR